MTLMKLGAALICAFALAACDKNSDTGAGTDTPDGFGVVGGDASNPATVAYFEQAIGDRVLFEVNQASLTQTALSIVDAQANWLLQYPTYTVRVEGHADEQGTREYNLALGARRAAAVRDHLVSRGIADNRITTVTYGKERPIEICSTEACWSQNRRSVTAVTTGLTS